MDILEEILGKIRAGNISEIHPALKALDRFIENDGFHDNDPVLSHIKRVVENVVFLTENTSGYRDYFSSRVGKYSRKELLAIAAAFHDISKGDVIREDNGKTSCSGHEEAGAAFTAAYLAEKGAGGAELEYIYRIVMYHGVPHRYLRPDNGNIKADMDVLSGELEGIYPDLLIFLKADILGSQLKEKNRQHFDFLVNQIERLLEYDAADRSAV